MRWFNKKSKVSANRIKSVPVGIFLPKPLHDEVTKMAKDLKISASSVVAFAVANECMKPFDQKWKIYSETPELFMQKMTDTNTKDARKLLTWMSADIERSYSREYLHTMRSYVGIESNENMAVAIQMLINAGLVNAVVPAPRNNGYTYPEGYRVLQVVPVEETKIDYTKGDKKKRKSGV